MCAAMLAVLLLGGCGIRPSQGTQGFAERACRQTADGFTVCEPSGPVPSGAVPLPAAKKVLATESSFAGIELGTPAREAKPLLVAALGVPETTEQTSCLRPELQDSLAQPLQAERLTWQLLELQVFFTHSAGTDDAVLSGWKVAATTVPPSGYDIQLPYGVRLDEPIRTALSKVPQSRLRRGDSYPDLGLVVTTPALQHFVLTPSDTDADGYVLEASYDPEGCR